LNKRPIRISAKPIPFSKGEINFVKTMFYDELALNDECPAPRTLGAFILEEGEGSNTHNLRDILDKKRQKKKTSSLGSQECVIV